MNQIVEILRQVGVFYIATADAEGKPHVRPFGAVAEFDGQAYITTSNRKNCFAEMMQKPAVEISGMTQDGSWIRLNAEVRRVDSDEIRTAMLEQNPNIRQLYHVGDGIFEVLLLENVTCTKYSFMAPPEVIA